MPNSSSHRHTAEVGAQNVTTPCIDFQSAVRAFVREESGVTAIEYGLLAALICVVIIAAVSLTGDNLLAIYNYWSASVVNAIT